MGIDNLLQHSSAGPGGKLCTEIAIMAKGRLAALGTLAELRAQLAQDSSLEEIFFSVAGGSESASAT